MRRTEHARRKALVLETLVLALLAAVSPVLAVTVSLAPDRDNSIYQEAENSNGQGVYLFAGDTAFEAARRALLRFDVAGAVPAGATIDSASLRLTCTLSPLGIMDPNPFALHRLSADWGEAGSDAGEPGGVGTTPASGDATWLERFFGMSSPWSTAGGDFDAASSASAAVAACPTPITMVFASTAQMVADLQGWVDDPASNFGWILIGDEAEPQSARRFASREAAASVRPRLVIAYTLPPPTPGAVPDGEDVPGDPLLLDKAGGGQIALEWSPSCLPADSYAIYEGAIGRFYSHVPATCSTGGATTATLTPVLDDAYYLVVPVAGAEEGSYGTDSMGAERPQLGGACFVQTLGDPVCP